MLDERHRLKLHPPLGGVPISVQSHTRPDPI